MGSIGEATESLPATKIEVVANGISLVHPLSRKGTGPGIILLISESGINDKSQLRIEDGIPSATMKWAEEGYCVVEVLPEAWSASVDPLAAATNALATADKCQPKETIGIVCYDYEIWNRVAPSASKIPSLAGIILYTTSSDLASLSPSLIPIAIHAAGAPVSPATERSKREKVYSYATTSSHLFATPFHPKFSYADEAVSHSRSLTFLKKVMEGPYFDLEAIWDEHTMFEFAERSVEKTMATMVQEPYVNHVPTLTGGIGRENLTAFYRDHFIFSNPADTELELISRTVGIDRVVDEFIFKFTHDTIVDWLFPGIPPTGHKVAIPMMAVVNIRGDRLYHEHISWDQATALAQLGLLPTHPAYSQAVARIGVNGASNGHAGPKLPIAGVATAEKMRDKNSVPSNLMF
ncbi:hypothetical protein B0A48_08861 [Cryoendolithus antarcticus]|uniref:SnoaL-like domain-containing protein n=1 Tax=Cryoendolithus antarcticus TaxID=1507870 RepID=A0A1V8T4D5_9PEZI|nr:hypothetical protein B0A48_08861 [Cryoendolithus antarcticus]